MFTKQLAITIQFIIAVVLTVSISALANGQQPLPDQSNANKVASNSKSETEQPATKAPATIPDFMGVNLGMAADDVRKKLGNLKDKGERQDFFVFSDVKSAQVFYDTEGKVTAFSIDYVGTSSEAPSPEKVLGVAVQPKADGSIYHLKRYPEAGYWIAYSRTTGENPITSVTMQKM